MSCGNTLPCGNMPLCNPPPYSATEQPRVQQQQPKNDIRPIPGNKFFAITTMVGAFLLCILGVIAIVVEAQMAYVGAPIWTGIVLVLPTGIIGLLSYWRQNSMCLNVCYLISSIMTCISCFALLFFASALAAAEFKWCDPEPGINYKWSSYRHPDDNECVFDQGGRIALDAVVALVAFIQMVVCIISLPFMCYGTFTCCYNCCRPESPQNQPQVQYQLVPIGSYQQSQNASHSVNFVVPQTQTRQMASSGPTMMAYSPQQVIIPASNSPAQTVQNPVTMFATPGTTQPVQMVAARTAQPAQMVAPRTAQPAQMVAPGTTQHAQMIIAPGTNQHVQMVAPGTTQPAQMTIAGTQPSFQVMQQPSHATYATPSPNMMVVASSQGLPQGQVQQPQPTTFVPAPGFSFRPQEVGAVQQPRVNAAPTTTSAQPQQGTVVSQSVSLAPGASVASPAPTANGTTTVANNPQTSSGTNQQQPPSDVSVSVGLTASDEFHDQNNLLETAEE